MTETGIGMLKLFEAFMPNVYLDAGKEPTIGYGHLIKPGEVFGTLTEPQAEDLLRQDVASHEADMRRLVKRTLTGQQDDALASFVFNIGAQQFRTSTMLRLLNTGRSNADVADEFTKWVFVESKRERGLVRRRRAEAACFLGANIKLIRFIYEVL
jgi:lysozyme